MLGSDVARDVLAATFHGACLRILYREIEHLGYAGNFTIYDSDDSQRLIKTCMTQLNISDSKFTPKSVQNTISSAKNRLISPEKFLTEAGDDYKLGIAAKVYALYQRQLKSANALDFDDIIMLTVKVLDDNPDILQKYQRKFRYVMVDEYQDTNGAQFKLVSLLAGGYNNICVVGDDDQSIYKFRGATIENILNFEKHFPNAKTVRLEQNYRSTGMILNAANSVIKNNTGRKSKVLWTDLGEGEKVTYYTARNETDEAEFVAKKIADSIENGGQYGDCAVLYRMNAQSAMIEQAFIRHGIPYRVFGGLKFFDRKEIKDVLAYLSIINNNMDMLRMKRIINVPSRKIGEVTVNAIEGICSDTNLSPVEVMVNAGEYAALSKKSSLLKQLGEMFIKLEELSQNMSLGELLDNVMQMSGYGMYYQNLGDEGTVRLENINELKTSMALYEENSEDPSLSGYLDEISLFTDLDTLDETADSVMMMTIHSSKGLEFPNVFVVGLEEEIFPSSRAAFDGEIEEERRLAYVSFTRAKKRLFLVNAHQRMLFGSTRYNQASRFVEEIDPQLLKLHRRNTPKTNVTVTVNRTPPLPAAKSKGVSQNTADVSFTDGDRIRHSIFGEGQVLTVTPIGNDSLIEIKFDAPKAGIKKIMAKFAKVEKLQ
jgi:DNA helicase-2/ATP-dependent DNA helicase PcrA